MSRLGSMEGPPHRPAHRLAVILCTLVVAAMVGSTPAHAASYRYWSYWWVQDGTWTFATAGPASSMPTDGAVEGWHFGITPQSGGQPPGFAASGAVDQACGGPPT